MYETTKIAKRQQFYQKTKVISAADSPATVVKKSDNQVADQKALDFAMKFANESMRFIPTLVEMNPGERLQAISEFLEQLGMKNMGLVENILDNPEVYDKVKFGYNNMTNNLEIYNDNDEAVHLSGTNNTHQIPNALEASVSAVNLIIQASGKILTFEWESQKCALLTAGALMIYFISMYSAMILVDGAYVSEKAKRIKDVQDKLQDLINFQNKLSEKLARAKADAETKKAINDGNETIGDPTWDTACKHAIERNDYHLDLTYIFKYTYYQEQVDGTPMLAFLIKYGLAQFDSKTKKIKDTPDWHSSPSGKPYGYWDFNIATFLEYRKLNGKTNPSNEAIMSEFNRIVKDIKNKKEDPGGNDWSKYIWDHGGLPKGDCVAPNLPDIPSDAFFMEQDDIPKWLSEKTVEYDIFFDSTYSKTNRKVAYITKNQIKAATDSVIIAYNSLTGNNVNASGLYPYGDAATTAVINGNVSSLTKFSENLTNSLSPLQQKATDLPGVCKQFLDMFEKHLQARSK